MLSLVVPVHNERDTLPDVLKRLAAVRLPVPLEVIVVDDGSTDGSLEVVTRDLLPDADRLLTVRSPHNRGKGAALRQGLGLATGDILGVQDADLEYDPRQIPDLIAPLLDGRAEVVYGTREFGGHSAYSFWYVVGNRMLNLVAGALFDRYITDAYTCYKFLTREVYERLRLTADGFDIEAEITGEVLRRGIRVFETPISYQARGREQGKKIRASDGLRGLLRFLEVRLRRG